MTTTLPINGRGQLTAEPYPDRAGVRFRIEDGRDEAFWADLHLTLEQLRDLVAECEGIGAEEDAAPEVIADQDTPWVDAEPGVAPF